MKIYKQLITGFVFLCLSVSAYPQDVRILETKVADILARMPADDIQLTDKLMDDMLSLGEPGIQRICDQIVPAGTGDDTRPRFAVESLSRFLSQYGKEKEKALWEKICIQNATEKKDNGVKDFFMKQLQIIGGDQSIAALKVFLSDKEICESALAAITAIGGKEAEFALGEALKNKKLPCAAGVMNALAAMKSKIAVNEYISWASDSNVNIKASAYNALAQSGSPLAYPILLKAAKETSYMWEPSGATTSLLTYAKAVGQSGDIKTMDKICKLVMAKCTDPATMQNKIAALDIYSGFNGINSLSYILKAAGNIDKEYRVAAMRMSLKIPGAEVTRKWIGLFPKAIPEAKPEIISMLGDRKDELALPLITSSLSNNYLEVRTESAAALVKISGARAIPSLIDYLTRFTNSGDQEAAKSALKSVMTSNKLQVLKPVLKDGPPATKKSVIEIMAWNRGHEYFNEVFPYTSFSDETVKKAAYAALPELAGPADQTKLIDLLLITDKPELVADVQTSIVNAALMIPDPAKRSDEILKALAGGVQKEKLIPLLAKTGGDEALKRVLNEFENGTPGMRDVCFKALTNWKDYSASSALYEICASGNKTFESQAFEGYVRQLRTTRLPDEEKLLLFRKIMPYALSSVRKNELLNEIGKLKTYQSLFFVANYLDNPETSAAAAKSAIAIALPDAASKAGLHGNIVRVILTDAVKNLKGPESDYDKEMVNKYLADMPADEGFQPMFNGKDLTGWQGLVENPVARAKMKPAELSKKQIEANKRVPGNWSVKDGCIWFNGKGNNLCSIKEYGDFEMIVDWKISKRGDSGIYLRGSPQVQIWDTSPGGEGEGIGSGGLYNNQNNPSKPLTVADNPVGDWNTFRIVMMGDKVSVWLNGLLVVDNVVMENYWDRKIPIFPKGPIELQAHGTDLAFRDIYVREINEKEFNLTPEERADGFVSLFNGQNLDNWIGNKKSYVVEDGMIVVKPSEGSGGNLYTQKEYSDFIFRFEFLLTPAANNGLGIRAPLTGDAAYVGMELQILDNTAPVYADLQPYQYHGSVYGVIPAKRGFLKPLGQWNYEEVEVRGTKIKITLNGTVILDGDIAGPRDNGTMDHNDHPGLKNKTGHIGFLGHGSELKFRDIRIKDLTR